MFHQPRGAPLWHHGGNFSLLERGFQAFSDMVFPGWMKGGACFFCFLCRKCLQRLAYVLENMLEIFVPEYIVMNRSEIHIKNPDYTEQDVFLESSKGRLFFHADVAPHVDPLLLPRGNRFEYVTATKASGNC